MAKMSYHDLKKIIYIYHDFIMILCHVGFTILSEQSIQNYFTVIKTNPFKGTKYKKEWWIFRPKWAKIKICIILSLLLKIRTNIHITNTQINQTVLYFQIQ